MSIFVVLLGRERVSDGIWRIFLKRLYLSAH